MGQPGRVSKEGIQHKACLLYTSHTTADFDYAKNLRFTPGAVQKAVEALHKGAFLVTDTNMRCV